MVGNSLFRKTDVYKYAWVRTLEGRVVDMALMDYVSLPKRMRGRLLDVNVCGAEGGGTSDHFLVEARLKVVMGWRSAGRMKCARNVLNVNELNKSVKEQGC